MLLCVSCVRVPVLSPEMQAVRDYVPANAVMAHRGSTYWAPEETESAWRWAREMGADYLESDLQCTKDGVILANHDENLKRTTDIEEVFGEGIPAGRLDFYLSLGFGLSDALEQLSRDSATFKPYYAASYYYAELLQLDAGSWFNAARPDQARPGFGQPAILPGCGAPVLSYSAGQYVSALQDQIAYAEGRMLARDACGRRILPYCLKPSCEGLSLAEIAAGAADGKYMEMVEYDFGGAYVTDPEDSGHRPGIYIEFKEPEVNPSDMEQRVYDILAAAGWNILTSPAESEDYYVDGRVNVGRTRGKVILQTFSTESLRRAFSVFGGQIPMCFLIWEPCPSDIPGGSFGTRRGFAAMIRWAQENGAHIIGPSIGGAPNDYFELDHPWQARLTRRAGMLNHPYSFDTEAQMAAHAAGADGFFTNRSDLTLNYLVDHGLRPCVGTSPCTGPYRTSCSCPDVSPRVSLVPDPVETLIRLGY